MELLPYPPTYLPKLHTYLLYIYLEYTRNISANIVGHVIHTQPNQPVSERASEPARGESSQLFRISVVCFFLGFFDKVRVGYVFAERG